MATDTRTHNDFSGSAERVTQLNERLVQAGKRTANLYLDSYEKFVEGANSFQQKLAEQSKNAMLKSVVETQVGLARDLASTYSAAARELVA